MAIERIGNIPYAEPSAAWAERGGVNAPVQRLLQSPALERLREAFGGRNVGLRFVTDTASGRILVQVVDAETSEVVRQIPPDEMLALARALDALQGALVALRA